MDTKPLKEVADILVHLDKTTLGMLLLSGVVVILWISFLFVVYLKNREIGRLVQAVNANTNAVNILLELTKLSVPRREENVHGVFLENLHKPEDRPSESLGLKSSSD